MIELENNKRFLHQWDLNKRVLLDGFDPGTRVEFTIANTYDPDPLAVRSYKEDGHVYANIPNIILQKDGYIKIRVCPPAGGPMAAQVKDIRVVQAEKPADYVYTETELLKTVGELLDKVKADPVYAALLCEVERLRDQCKNFAFLCNKILQDCNKALDQMGGKK